jgi:tetratricopeptide (TPR) repeat protein
MILRAMNKPSMPLMKHINLSDSEAEYHYNKGTTLVKLDKVDEAIAEFDKALEIEPSPRAYLAKGLALITLENYEEALKAFDAGIALDDTKADLWAQKAFALYKLQKLDEARAAIDKALSFDETWQYALDLKALIENPDNGNVTSTQSDNETTISDNETTVSDNVVNESSSS